MNYKERLKEEQFEFDPHAWESFQYLRQDTANPSPNIPAKGKSKWLFIFFLLGFLGWFIYPQEQSNQQQTKQLSSELTVNSGKPLISRSKTELDRSQDHLAPQKADAKAVLEQEENNQIAPQIIKEEVIEYTPFSRNTITTTVPPVTAASLTPLNENSLTRTTAKERAQDEQVQGSSLFERKTAENIAVLKTRNLSTNLISFTQFGHKLLIDSSLITTTKPKLYRPKRWELRLNIGRGNTAYRNYFQTLYGFNRANIAGWYGQIRLVRPLNNFLAVGLAGSYYDGKDQIFQPDNLVETDQRLAILGQVQFTLIQQQRLSAELIFGTGYEFSNSNFANLEMPTTGPTERVLKVVKENRFTFQSQFSLAYQLSAASSFGVYANHYSSNNGFYSYGLSYKFRF